MNKNFYFFANLFLGITLVSGVLQSLIRFQVGIQMFYLDSFTTWFLVATSSSLIGSLFLLRYYYHKKYWITFSAALVATFAVLFQSVIIYIILKTRQLESYYIPSIFLSLSAGIFYAVSLFVSRSKEKFWLKNAGIFIFCIDFLLLSGMVWFVSSQDGEVRSNIEKLTQWIILVGSLLPLFFIKNFSGENQLAKEGNVLASHKNHWGNAWAVAGLVACISTIVFGVLLANESTSSVYWGKRNFENTQRLAQLFESRSYVNNRGNTLLYRLLKPLDYDSTKKYPLVISLPYGGQPGTDTIRQIEGAAAAELLSEAGNRRKYPAFLFIPHCPPGSGWGGIPNYPAVDSLVYEALTALNEPGIDRKRIYVTGISRGGYGSWNFISKRPDLFAAAVPVCGAGNPKLAPNAVKVAVWAFHGENDRNVPVSGSREMIEAIKKAGGTPKYTEFSGAGHNIWYQVTQTPGLLDWLFAQQKE